MVAGLALLVLLAPLELALRRRRQSGLAPTRVAFAVATLVGLVWSYRVFNGWADALMLVPFAALGLAGLVSMVSAYVHWRAAAVVATAWALVAVYLGQDWSRHMQDGVLLKQEREVADAMAALPDDATVVSVEAPQVLVLTGRTNPTQHQMFRAGLEEFVDDTWPGGLAGYADTIRADAPTVVVVGARRALRLAAARAGRLHRDRHESRLVLVRARRRRRRGPRPGPRRRPRLRLDPGL